MADNRPDMADGLPPVQPARQAGGQPAVPARERAFVACGHRFPLGRKTYIMGILNVTPDSFSDGGRYATLETALRHAEKLIHDGADVIDVGGESTRPGAEPVDAETETERVAPVIEAISARFSTPVSIDTYHARTAEAALAAGASIVNDITGLRGDDGMAGVVARSDAGAVLMFHAGLPAGRLSATERSLDPGDWQGRMTLYLQACIWIAQSSGIPAERLMLDPGVGFSMDSTESIELLRQSGCLRAFGLPLLFGTSRKRLISQILGGREMNDRLLGTAATVCYSIVSGADFVRVHDVAEMADVTRVMDALWREGSLQ